MEPVLAAMWKIIFPAILCLAQTGTTDKAKTALPANTNGETVATLPSTKPCITDTDVACTGNTSSSGYSTTMSAVVTAPKKSAGTIAGESITLAPRNMMSVANFGNATVASGDATTANEHEGTTAGGAAVTNTAPPGVSSTATTNASRSVSNITASEQTPSATVTTALSPGGATSKSGTPSADTSNPLRNPSLTVHAEVTPAKPPEHFTSLSPGVTTWALLRKTSTPGHGDTTHDAMTIDPGNAAHILNEPVGNAPGSANCYSICDIIPAWATVLLCLATAFFLFMLVGCIFLLPYCTKLRQPAPVASPGRSV